MKKLIIVLCWLSVAAPFINHLVYCFQSEKYLFLIAGAILTPVGWFHGLGLFFGFWG